MFITVYLKTISLPSPGDHIDETDDHDENEKNDAHDDILSNGNDDSPEPDAEDVSVSLQRSKNLSLLQSQ